VLGVDIRVQTRVITGQWHGRGLPSRRSQEHFHPPREHQSRQTIGQIQIAVPLRRDSARLATADVPVQITPPATADFVRRCLTSGNRMRGGIRKFPTRVRLGKQKAKDKVLWQIPLGGPYIPFSGKDRSPASAFAVLSSVLHAQPIQVLNLTPSRSARSCAAICCRCAESAILNSLGRRPSRWPFVVFLKLHGVT